MAAAKAWTITQLGIPGTIVTLDGPNAPHGRPRVAPIVEDEIAVRENATYYPGNPVPTRHTFGPIHTDITLTGRFMDSYNGKGNSAALAQTLKQMVAQEQPVRLDWGDNLSLTGLLLKFKPSRESEAEIAWTMVFGIDSDASVPLAFPTPPTARPGDQVGAMAFLLPSIAAVDPPPADIGFEPGFLESLANAVDGVRNNLAVLTTAANAIDNFEQATFSSLNRLRSAVGQTTTACLQLQSTLDDASSDVALALGPASSSTDYQRNRATSASNNLALIALLAALDVQAAVAVAGQPHQTHTVQGGDSWESLSRKFYGGASSANALRQANGARYGQKPGAGRQIHVPKG